MTINELQDNVIEEFSDFDDWMDKYALLIDLGNSLPLLVDQHPVRPYPAGNTGCRPIFH